MKWHLFKMHLLPFTPKDSRLAPMNSADNLLYIKWVDGHLLLLLLFKKKKKNSSKLIGKKSNKNIKRNISKKKKKKRYILN